MWACASTPEDEPTAGSSAAVDAATSDSAAGATDAATSAPDAVADTTSAADTGGPVIVDSGGAQPDTKTAVADTGGTTADTASTPVDAGPKDSSTAVGRLYGGAYNEETPALAVFPDGSALLAGYTESAGAGDWDMVAIRTDACGKPTWTRTYGSAGKDEARGVAAVSDGGAWLVGSTDGFGGGTEAYIVRIDASGAPKFAHVHGGSSFDAAVGVAATSDQGAIVVAKTYSFGPGTPSSHNLLALRVDAAGKLVWGTAFGGAEDGDAGFAVVALSDEAGKTDGFAFAGATESFGIKDDDFWVMKLDAAGKHLWSNAYGGTLDDEARGLTATSAGGLAVVGFSRGFGAVEEDVLVLGLDGAGKVQWSTRLGTDGEERAYGVAESQGSLFVVGRSDGFGSGDDGFLARIDGKGSLAWARRSGGSAAREMAAVGHAAAGALVMSGHASKGGAGGRDALLVRTNAAAAAGCADSDGKGSELKGAAVTVTTVAFTPGTAEGVKTKAVATESALVPNTFISTQVCAGGGC